MATKKFDLFGQSIETDEHGFFSAPNGDRVKWFKPRNLVNGRRVDFVKLLEVVRDYFQAGLTGSQIAQNLSKDTDTIGRYKKIIVAFNALDETAINKNRDVNAEFRNEDTAKMLERFDTVKAWHDTLIEGGKSRRGVRIFASSLNRACQILKISPESFCQKGFNHTGEQLKAINRNMFVVSEAVESESSFYSIRMAVRSWLAFNEVSIPRGNLCPKYLSGMIVSTHGQANHVRASMAEIAKANELLESSKTVLPFPSRRQDTEIYFKFGIETASRSLAIITAEMYKWNGTAKQFKTFERKLQHVGKHRMTKRIFCPELIRLLNERQQAGEKCLIGKQNEYVNFSQIGNESADDIHQTSPQKKALKEINENLRAIYQQVGGNMADPYFTKKPSHSLRHVSAQYWLLKSSFDYGFVAKLGGWFTIDELRASYGEMPPNVFDAKYGKYINSDGSEFEGGAFK